MGVTEMGEGREKDDECPYVHFMGSDLCEKECVREHSKINRQFKKHQVNIKRIRLAMHSNILMKSGGSDSS